jgi:cob(I)alamin adenosyltransferase
MEALGSLDELSAALGLARSMLTSTAIQNTIISIQRKLYELMAEVAASAENAEKFRKINENTVTDLEKIIDDYSMNVEVPQGFIVPGETPASAAISLARTIARRAERRTTELASRGDIQNVFLTSYLNRLSSFLFVLEIILIQESEKGHPMLAQER